MRIVLTGGGTSGHILPFEPIVAAIRTKFLADKEDLPSRLDPKELRLYFVGVSSQKTKDFFQQYDVEVTHVPSGKLRRYASALTFIDLLIRLPIGIVLALFHMWRIMPEVVISKGGYGSLPVVLAAVFYRIPILLHESDAVPGMANSFLMRFVTAIALGFAAAQEKLPLQWRYKAIVTGTPVRRMLFSLTSSQGKAELGIAEAEKVLLVVGGSQGAKQINEAIVQILPKLVLDFTIIHVTGSDHIEAVKEVTGQLLAQSSRRSQYHAYAYLESEFAAALQAADGVVSRAGSTVAELVAVRKPMLLIPLDSAAADHQRANARLLEAAGAAMVLDPNNLGVNLLEQNIHRLMTDETLRANLVKNMDAIDLPQAATTIADLTFTLARGLVPHR